MKHFNTQFLLLFLALLLSTTAFSQGKSKLLDNIKQEKNSVLKPAHSKDVIKRTNIPIASQNKMARPEVTKTRLNIVTEYEIEYDDDADEMIYNSYPEDSTILYWPDGIGQENLAESLLATEYFYPGYMILFQKSEISIHTDSIHYKSEPDWEVDARMTSEFNTQNQLVKQVYQELDGGIWEEEIMRLFQYDDQGRLLKIETYMEDQPEWELYTETSFSYNDKDLLIGEETIYIDESVIYWGYKFSNEYNSDDMLIRQYSYYWDDASADWVVNYRANAEYENGRLLREYDEYVITASIFENDEQYLYLYDSVGQNIGLEIYEYDEEISDWVISGKIDYEYLVSNVNTATIFDYDESETEPVGRYIYYHNGYNQCRHFGLELYYEGDWYPYEVLLRFNYELYEATSDAENLALSDTEFNIYPNPTSESITVQLSDDYINSVRIYDMNGRLMRQVSDNLNSSEMNISLDNLSSGTYLLEVISAGKKGVKKFIIQ